MERARDWPLEVHRTLKAARVRVVGYVPDAGLTRLIALCRADRAMRSVALTTEEEGIGLAAGAWLGGARAALLMQSSGVGNCVNALGMIAECRIPLLLIVTMRGERGEFNSWQVPMGRAAGRVLREMEVKVFRAADENVIDSCLKKTINHAFRGGGAAALLIAQRVIGIKSFAGESRK